MKLCCRRFALPFAVVLMIGLLACLPACSVLHRQHEDQPADNHSTSRETNPGLVGKRTSGRGLTLELKTAPDPVKLGETREINVTLIVRNNSKVTANLKFANSQLIEILLREPDTGKVVSQWSADRTFGVESRYVVINPKERLEYNEPITTRELKAGKAYNLEAYFIGYDQELRATKVIIPQP